MRCSALGWRPHCWTQCSANLWLNLYWLSAFYTCPSFSILILIAKSLKKELRIRLFNFDFTSISYVLIISSNLLILFNISFNDAYNPITLTYLIPFINFKFVGALLLFEWCCYSQNGFLTWDDVSSCGPVRTISCSF